MLPTYDSLKGCITKTFVLGEPVGPDSFCAQISETNDTVTVQSGGGKSDDGLWVPYMSQKAIWGEAKSGKEKWAGSGPFSGCILDVGVNNGNLCVAHLSQESGSQAVAEWRKKPEAQLGTHRRWKVSFKKELQLKWPATHVFLTWKEGIKDLGNDLKVVVVFVQTQTMGGANGTILEVWEPLAKNVQSEYATFEQAQ